MSLAQRFPSLSHWGAFTAVVQDGRLQACEPFAFDAAPSAILQSMPGMVHSPLRIQKPAIRAGWLRDRGHSDGTHRGHDSFVEVSWDRALGLVAEEIARVRTSHGSSGIFGGSYGWSSAGRLHHARTLTHKFLFSGGGCVSQSGNYSWGAAQTLLPHVIGTYSPVTGRVTDWNSVVDHTQLLLCFGGYPLRNTQITSGGAGRHDTASWLQRASKAGMQVVCISPAQDDLPAEINARWLPIHPNTDTALMLAMLHTLLLDQAEDREFLQRYCEGWEPLQAYVLGHSDGIAKSAQWAADICGIEAEQIVQLARQARSCTTLVNCTWSLQRAEHGEQPYWAAIALAAALGGIGKPGAGFAFGHGSMNGVAQPRQDLASPEQSAGANPAKLSIPVARIADMLLHPGQAYECNGETGHYPDTKLVYWAGGNPFHHHQDLGRLLQAWSRPETIVVHDAWWTPTARRADIVLPATTTLERNDIGGSSRDDFVFAMHQALPPQGLARNDFDIYSELAERAGHGAAFHGNLSEMQWLQRIYEDMLHKWQLKGFVGERFDAFWERGWLQLPRSEQAFVLFEKFRQDPQAHPLQTPSGKIELYSQRIASFGYADCPAHPTWLPPQEWLGAETARNGLYPLHLVSPQPADKLHSQLDAGETSAQRKVDGRQRVQLHPEDARQRGIATGDVVEIFNARGRCLASAEVHAGVMRGVVVLPTGAWFDPVFKEGQCIDRHGNPNVLTRDAGTSRLAQGPAAMSALVQVRCCTEAVSTDAMLKPQPFVLPDFVRDEAQGLSA
ncbi:MAG: molybdopterin-dependent oxidoreductase [Comamonas sp.]